MTTLEDLQRLKQDIADAERRRAKRDADIDALEAKLRENLRELKKYGVESVTEGRAMLVELEKTLQEDIEKLRTALREEVA